ncbi:MAG: diguanylate cyclase domain-containing protein [Nocardioides sp.]
MRAWGCVGSAVAAGLVFVGALELPGLSPFTLLVISNAGQLVASALAAVLAFLVARRPDTAHRRAWLALSLAVGCWSAGQLVWSYYEVIDRSEVPFPSLADVGFLLFPVAATIGLWSWLGSQGTLVARGRDLLDGAIMAVSLLALSWMTVLGSVLAEASGGWLSVLLPVAYPVGDVMLGTLALLALARGHGRERAVLGILALGLAFLAAADSSYTYLVSVGQYTSADVISSGWVFGFLLVAAAAGAELGAPSPPAVQPAEVRPADEHRVSVFRLLLPYVPFATVGGAVLYKFVTYPGRPLVALILCVGLVVMVLSRQFLAMAENQRLYVALGAARDQLQHQALHDHLTELPNRALFTDRLDHALRQPGVDLGLLFCDLDDFKQVNDLHGHTGGDQLLAEVAGRLLACVRDGDTVARLGGDEFAILLEKADDTQQVADRVITSMLDPFELHGENVAVSMSLGVVQHRAAVPDGVGQGRRRGELAGGRSSDPAFVAHRMLREADLAMYAAKTSGKGKAVVAGESPAPDETGPGGKVESGPKRT